MQLTDGSFFCLGGERRPKRVADGPDLGEVATVRPRRTGVPLPDQKPLQARGIPEELRIGLERVPRVGEIDGEGNRIVR